MSENYLAKAVTGAYRKRKSTRLVGAELECVIPSSIRYDGMWDHFASVLGQDAHVHGDGSIRARRGGSGLECATYPANGDAFVARLVRVCGTLDAFGARVNSSCGTHVHLDVRSYTDEQRQWIVNAWDSLGYCVRRMVPVRRRGNPYCRQRSLLRDSYTRYGDLNVLAFPEHGTFEIRLHQGTLSANTLVAWVDVMDWLFTAAAAGKLITLADVPAKDRRLVEALKLAPAPADVRRTMIKRIRSYASDAPAILEGV